MSVVFPDDIAWAYHAAEFEDQLVRRAYGYRLAELAAAVSHGNGRMAEAAEDRIGALQERWPAIAMEDD